MEGVEVTIVKVETNIFEVTMEKGTKYLVEVTREIMGEPHFREGFANTLEEARVLRRKYWIALNAYAAGLPVKDFKLQCSGNPERPFGQVVKCYPKSPEGDVGEINTIHSNGLLRSWQ